MARSSNRAGPLFRLFSTIGVVALLLALILPVLTTRTAANPAGAGFLAGAAAG